MLIVLSRNLLMFLALLWVLPLPAAPLQWPASDELLNNTTTQIRALAANASAIRVDGIALAMPGQVSRFYQQREFRPIWVEQHGVHVAAAELMQAIKHSPSEGLPVADYPVEIIDHHLMRGLEGASQLAKLDLLLTDTFLHYSRNVRSGRIGPRRVGGSWLLPYTRFDGSALLTQALAESSLGGALAALPPSHGGYQRLRTVLQHYRTVEAQGGWLRVSPGETLEKGSKGPRVVELRERLRQSGDLADKRVEEPELFDDPLSEAVQRFQERHGLEGDGRVGKRTLATLNLPVALTLRQIEANMERWRWLPRELEPRHIRVNMAGYELEVIESGVQVMNMRVIVGRNVRQTPVFSSQVTQLVLNPYWFVPHLIFREDILPGLRRDPRRFERLNMRLLRNGAVVDAGTVDWSSVDPWHFPFTLRQEPGPQNALGRIKFLMPNNHGIYLHDTPDRHLFERTTRAFSSGCIRLERPLELAQYLLANPAEWDIARLEEAIATEAQQTLTVPEPVPIYFTYWTAWVDQAGALQTREDIYHRDRRLLRLWRKSAT